MTRTDIINHFIEKRGYENYLEIGVFHGENFKNVKAKFKTGVDPVRKFSSNEPAELLFAMTSDEYFNIEPPDWKKDIIFIDGLHTEEQVAKDIVNSLKWLAPNGVIILHDCNPPTELHARPEYTNEMAEWNGTVYKAWIRFRSKHTHYTYTVDTDWGCGVIDISKDKGFYVGGMKTIPVTFKEFDANREKYLNLISSEEFLKKV